MKKFKSTDEIHSFIENSSCSQLELQNILKFIIKEGNFAYSDVEKAFYEVTKKIDVFIYEKYKSKVVSNSFLQGYFSDFYIAQQYIDSLCQKFAFEYEINLNNLQNLRKQETEDYYWSMGAQVPDSELREFKRKKIDIICTMKEPYYEKWIPTKHKPKTASSSIGYVEDNKHFINENSINKLALFLIQQIKDKSLLSQLNTKSKAKA